jgi:hypothetical protein
MSVQEILIVSFAIPVAVTFVGAGGAVVPSGRVVAEATSDFGPSCPVLETAVT